MTFRAPVRRRIVAYLVVGPIAIAAAIGLVFFASNTTFSGALATATLITALVVALGLLAVLLAFMPTQIEIRDDERIHLVAPRTTTAYVPAEMAIRRRPDGDYDFVRVRTNRTVAVFHAGDPEAAEAAFAHAGAEIRR